MFNCEYAWHFSAFKSISSRLEGQLSNNVYVLLYQRIKVEMAGQHPHQATFNLLNLKLQGCNSFLADTNLHSDTHVIIILLLIFFGHDYFKVPIAGISSTCFFIAAFILQNGYMGIWISTIYRSFISFNSRTIKAIMHIYVRILFGNVISFFPWVTVQA